MPEQLDSTYGRHHLCIWGRRSYKAHKVVSRVEQLAVWDCEAGNGASLQRMGDDAYHRNLR